MDRSTAPEGVTRSTSDRKVLQFAYTCAADVPGSNPRAQASWNIWRHRNRPFGVFGGGTMNRAVGLLAIVLFLGCPESPTAPPAVASVAVTPPSVSLTVHHTTQLAASARDAAGNPLSDRPITWSSSNTTIAQVSTTGLVSGMDVGGPVTITATSEGKSGTGAVMVTPPPVASVTVTAASPTVPLGSSEQLTATLQDADGNVLTGRAVAWTSSDAGVASVNDAGLVTANAVGGPVTITATAEGKSGTATITVIRVPVGSVGVTPSIATVTLGGTLQLTAIPKDAGGTPLTGRDIAWSGDNPGVADVSATGLVTAKAVGGPVTITATSEGKSGSSLVTVSPVPVASVAVTPPTANIVVGKTVQLTAVAQDANGNALAGRSVAWSSGNTATADVDATGLVTAKAVGGPVTITAMSEGKTGTATITVIPAPVASVAVTPPTANVVIGKTQQLTAVLQDADGHPLTGRSVAWTSGNGAIADVDATGLVTGKALGGPVTITATSEGKSGTASVTVIVAPVASVTVSPATANVIIGNTAQFTAVPRDADGNPVTGRFVAWASSDPTTAEVDGAGLVTGKVVGGPVTITATSEGKNGTATVTVLSFAATGPLRVSAVNPRYFTDGTGRAIYLTGSHTWPNFQDVGLTDPPTPFSWTAYLDFLVQHHHNVMKLWRWEQAKWSAEIPNDVWYYPMPYLRTGSAMALDGKPQFDLTQFDPAYFARMRTRVIQAGQRGIYVSIMLFDGWSIEGKGAGIGNPWPGHPFNAANNINGINGDPNNTGEGLETHTLHIPTIVALQEAYVRRVIDAVNDLDNVLYEISNESRAGTGAEEWEEYMITKIKQYEATKPKQHPVGMTVLWPGGSNDVLFTSSADWIAPNGSVTNPPPADGRKVILNDTDHLCGICLDVSWVWESLTRGLNPMLMDPFDGAYAPTAGHYDLNDPRWELVRRNLGYARSYADRMNLIAMQPHGELAPSTGYCLAHVGVEYLVYLPSGGPVTVDLTGAGTLTVEWFNPTTGQTTPGGTTPGGPGQVFTPPTGGDAVLYIH